MKSAITISLVNEARGGPFVYWDDLAAGFAAGDVRVHAARIETVGGVAVDRFEVTGPAGTKLPEELQRSVRAAIRLGRRGGRPSRRWARGHRIRSA